MAQEITGSCMCGSVRYRASSPFRPIIACHCTQCRKSTGHHMAASAALKKNFELTASDTLRWYHSGTDSRRGFCENCGTTLFFERPAGDRISFTAGTVDGDTGLAMAAHIFVAEKGDYYDIPADSEAYDGECNHLLGLSED